MANIGIQGAAIPVVVVQSAVQAALAAGAEVFFGIALPSPLVVPPPGTVAGVNGQVFFCQVVTNDAAGASLVCTGNLNTAGNPTFQVRVRNVGAALSNSFAVNLMLFQAGGAIGI